MNNFNFKKTIPFIGVLLFFITISLGYFYPQMQGKQLATHDQKQWKGGAKELNDKYHDENEVGLWSNSMFGGMPAYFVVLRSPNNFIAKYVRPITSLGIERPAVYIIWSLMSFFLLMMVMRIKIPIAILGSVGYAFTSYNFVIMAAGHFAKVMALGYLPGILAGVILLRNKKYLWGLTVSALFMSFEMISNHPQMTYYFFVFFLVAYFVLAFISDIKKNDVKGYLTSAVLFGIAVILGILPSASQLFTTQEYTSYSTRGKSELTINSKEDATTGLDRSYITNWSGGIAETWSLLIPNAKGPGSGKLSDNETAVKSVDKQFKKTLDNVDAYWGDQPFIGGPMYAGAIIMFLFVLGLFLVDGILKWSLVFAAVITTMLSWGKNFPGLTNFFIDYFPMYNKFRAVVSIEIVALFAFPVIGALALKKFFSDGDFLNQPMEIFGKKLKYSNSVALIFAFAFTGGVSFLFWLMPTTFFDFFKAGEYENYVTSLQSNNWPAGQIDDLLNTIETARIAVFKADALRSFGFILLAAGAMFGFAKQKLQANTVMYALIALVLLDMWTVNTRYMNVKDGFESKRKVTEPFAIAPVNKAILADKTPGHRVLNIAANTFNETGTSYFHHSIGGYNGAKLKNYQELVEFHLSKEIQMFMTTLRGAKSQNDLLGAFENTPVLNMLNTKYIIYDPNSKPIVNTNAQTSAWFVNNIKWVETADEEILALNQVDLKSTAIIRNDQKEFVGNIGNGKGEIELVSYDADKLEYKSNATTDQVAVLSEIWYPVGWTATIDGKEVPISRANYLLRTINVPAGEHIIKLEFAPSSYYTGEIIALIGSVIIVILILAAIILAVRNRQTSQQE
ncbi:MAG: YfhO family protein [Salibacteraceae bacterium]